MPVEARWWEPTQNNKIKCTLCPRYCTIGEGQKGFCYIRENTGGKLFTTGYGSPTGFAIDPIEKKPLNHFLAGTGILSFGTAGCNLGCKFCQNWTISKSKLDELNSYSNITPEDVIKLAKENNVPSIAFTYNDPVIIGEYVIDISRLAKEEGIRTVMVTAGYIDKEARKDVFRYIDAANVDLKAFTEEFYFKLTSSHLNDVLDTLIWLKNETDVWFEITNLLIPGQNDSSEEIKRMCGWICENLGVEVPVHFTAFHPDFKMKDIPATPVKTVINARKTGLAEGLQYCYTGNIYDETGQNTYCSNCGEKVITRNRYSVSTEGLSGNKCKRCNEPVSGVFR